MKGVAWGTESGGTTVDALILGLLIDIMEVSQNLNSSDMTPRIINNSLRPILHQKLE
jgi:hypothetical protein